MSYDFGRHNLPDYDFSVVANWLDVPMSENMMEVLKPDHALLRVSMLYLLYYIHS